MNREPAVDASMARVLQAEQAARASVAAARDEAAHIGERARAEARGIADRARERVARAHARVESALQAALAALAAEARSLPGHDEPDDAARARLEHAVQRLAAELTAAPALAATVPGEPGAELARPPLQRPSP